LKEEFMHRRLFAACLLPAFWIALAGPTVAHANEGDAMERVATMPLMVDGVLYTASFTRPEHAGHLRALDLTGSTPLPLWDAAERVPAAGTGAFPGDLSTSDPPRVIDADNLFRSLLTNLPDRQDGIVQPFTALAATTLLPPLQLPGINAARALINRVRGRSEVTDDCVDGTGEAPHRLWGISRSTPAAVGRSPWLANTTVRPQMIYAGAEDGQLHAFHAGDWDAGENRYDPEGPAAGRELWSYLPGHLLPGLAEQPFDLATEAFAVHVDGSPAVADLYADGNGNGLRRWRTLLVGTATLTSQTTGLAFALDITDPLQPELLWERVLPGTNVGRTRGAMLGTIDAVPPMPAAFLTTGLAEPADPSGAPAPLTGRYGIRAGALDPASGLPLWEWQVAYPSPIAGISTTPAVPAILDSDGDTLADALVFGDMAGRLWVLDAATGQPRGGGAAFQVEGGCDQPIGAGVAVHGRLVVFGTGGAEHADPNGGYAIYGVEILPTGARLRWRYPLAYGEQVWSAPVVDRLGRIYFAAAENYRPGEPGAGAGSRGRLIILDRSGRQLATISTETAVPGRVMVGPGAALAVTLSGRVYQFGSVHREVNASSSAAGALQLFSWRIR